MNGRHRETTLDVQESGQAPRPARQLGDRESVRDIVPSGAAILLGKGATYETELPEAAQKLERELRPVPVVRRCRDDLAVHELADQIPDPFLLIREQTARVYEVNRPLFPVRSLRCNGHQGPSMLLLRM